MGANAVARLVEIPIGFSSQIFSGTLQVKGRALSGLNFLALEPPFFGVLLTFNTPSLHHLSIHP